jgi:hypothetical protein
LKPDEAASDLVGRIKTGSSNHIKQAAMDWVPFFVAGRFWRFFRFAFASKRSDQLHPQPGESPSPQIISAGVFGIFGTP